MLKFIFVFLGILSALYGILILQVGSGSSFWMIWEAIGICFFLWAFLYHTDFFTAHKILKLSFYALLTIGAVTLTILCSMIGTEFNAKGNKNLDYIIVLGAQVKEDGPSVVLKYRLDSAINYLNQNPETICIVSGGQGSNETRTEAEGMYDYLTTHGIASERILLEDQSKNTMENIKYSKLLLDESYQNVGIVTNNFHTFRAVRIAKAQGLHNVCGIAAESTALYLPNNVLRECLGILKEYMMRNI